MVDRNSLLVAAGAALATAGLWYLARRGRGDRHGGSVEYREVGGSGEPPKGPCVLVTGGTGFVGRWVIKALIAAGREGGNIISFDARAPPEGQRVGGVLYVVGSLLQEGHLERAMRGRGVRAVLHVAGIKSFVYTLKSQLWNVNVEGTRSVIRACKAMGVHSLVYTSSLTVAMDPTAPPAQNTMMSVDAPYAAHPLDEYARSKIAAEKLVLEANGSDLETVSLRPSAIYGPGDDAIFDPITVQANIPTFGDGKQTWDWVSVFDVANAHSCALQALEAKKPGVAGHAFFVGQGETFVYREMFLTIGNFIHKQGQIAGSLPLPLAKALALFQGIVYRLTGLVTFHVSMTVDSINFTQVGWSVDIAPTRTRLGYAPAHPTTVETVRNMVKGEGLLLEGK